MENVCGLKARQQDEKSLLEVIQSELYRMGFASIAVELDVEAFQQATRQRNCSMQAEEA